MRADHISFWYRGSIMHVEDVAATTTVLDWLRRDPATRGTKEGCNEGDCGACTVGIGTLSDDAQNLVLSTANACLLFLPMLHGRALFTIEDVGGADDLHPVQSSMVDSHGSQCGFCTPGIVMSMWRMYEQGRTSGHEPTRQELADGLAGNLCRCTGYRSILDASEEMLKAEGPALDTSPILDALRSIDDSPLDYHAAGTRFWAPLSLDELCEVASENPEARILGGGTDLSLNVTQHLRELPALIWTGRVRDLAAIAADDTHVHIGAGATLEAAWSFLASNAPSLEQMWLRFASPSIRQVGTMGGNLVNGSPIGDSAPVLLALDAELELRQGTSLRRLPLRDFYLGYQANALLPGEVLTAIVVPRAALARQLRAYKVSRRFDSDISAVSGAFALSVSDGIVREARLAFGGLAPIVHRADRAEAALVGRPWDAAALADAQSALGLDFSPISDHRAGAEYRRHVAIGLLERLWLQTRSDALLNAEATDVWARS
jgi:xanthine dehydrogenase small subunit